MSCAREYRTWIWVPFDFFNWWHFGTCRLCVLHTQDWHEKDSDINWRKTVKTSLILPRTASVKSRWWRQVHANLLEHFKHLKYNLRIVLILLIHVLPNCGGNWKVIFKTSLGWLWWNTQKRSGKQQQQTKKRRKITCFCLKCWKRDKRLWWKRRQGPTRHRKSGVLYRLK